MTPGQAADALADWKRRYEELEAERDGLIRAAHVAGMNIRQVALGLGVSRTTVYKVLGDGVVV